MNELTETQKAYIAGIVDGEGCINISRAYKTEGVSTYHALQIWIVNCDKGLIDYLMETIGEGFTTAQDGRKDNHRTLHGWHISRRSAREFLLQIYDYLVIKKDQADVALEFMKTYDKNPLGGRGYVLPKSLVSQRDEYMRLLRQLKKESTTIDGLSSRDDRIIEISQIHTQKQLCLF